MASVRLISWNTGGLNGPVKRSRVLTHLKKLKGDIMFIQESHLKVCDQSRLRKPWVSQIFHSSFNTRARGVAILINRRIQFTPTTILSDPNGRYIIVAGLLFHTPVLLVNVYAPNWDDVDFANNLLASLPNLNTHHLIFGGDLNCVMDPRLDRSNPRTLTLSKMSKSFSAFMDDNGCVDVWRHLNPTRQVFSFFSHVHRSFSRIDYVFLDRALVSSIKAVDYLAIVISDHAPLQLDISFDLHMRDPPLWRFNPLLLSDEDFCTKISGSLDTFLETNKSDQVSHSLLWETLKVFIRGEIISFVAHANKARRGRVKDLSDSIQDLDVRCALDPSPTLLKERENKQSEFNLLSTSEAERLILHSRGRYYEYGDKNSRLLAHQLKRQAASRLIPEVMDNSGTLRSNPREINKVFEKFYTALYTSESPSDRGPMDSFLDSLDIPTIEPDSIAELDKPLELEEINAAIMAMQSGKSPGPDGFVAEFFKKFKNKLSPILLDMYRDSLDKECLPTTLTQATITVLLKKDKDPKECGAYRPISLLNVDAKILAKVLARRLEVILPQFISEDQTGFVKGRFSFSNIRKLLNIIHSSPSTLVPEAVVSLDAEKAFDRIEWEYLFAVLHRFGAGSNFISWVKLLYSSPQACISTNSLRSPYFPLTRGTRQGCPLSPLLFAIAIEPLSIALKKCPQLQGIRRYETVQQVSLYADDLLLYVSDPINSFPAIQLLLKNFGSFSGYKLNFQKSECYPINELALKISQNSIPFRLATSGFKYLGVNITRSLSSLLGANFTPLVENMKADFLRWSNLPLSLSGRIQSVKMTTLPKFLYMFRCLPVFLPKAFFQSVNKAISSFIWAGKNPRIGRPLLQRPRNVGGLALPSFIHYYWAAHLQKLSFWINAPETDWCIMEAQSCHGSSLQALVYSSLPLKPSSHSLNPIVLSSLKIWIQFRRHHKFIAASCLGPISSNHLFPPSALDSTFSRWGRANLKCVRDLYEDGHFLEFAALSRKYNIDNSNLFRYFQIRHFVRQQFPSFPNLPAEEMWEGLLGTDPSRKGLISDLYCRILSAPDTISKIKTTWENELGLALTEDWWKGALDRINGTSSCARLSLIQFKVVHRTHFSKVRLAEIYPDVDPNCNRCGDAQSHLSHMFWSCPRLSAFWSSVFEVLSKVLKVGIQPCPLLAIFGVPAECPEYNTQGTDIVAFTTLLARRRILMAWKSPDAPSFSVWLKDIMYFLRLEKIKFSLRGSNKRFLSKWQPFISYFNDLSELPPD